MSRTANAEVVIGEFVIFPPHHCLVLIILVFSSSRKFYSHMNYSESSFVLFATPSFHDSNFFAGFRGFLPSILFLAAYRRCICEIRNI